MLYTTRVCGCQAKLPTLTPMAPNIAKFRPPRRSVGKSKKTTVPGCLFAKIFPLIQIKPRANPLSSLKLPDKKPEQPIRQNIPPLPVLYSCNPGPDEQPPPWRQAARSRQLTSQY